MLKKNIFPMHLFLIYEHVKPIIWTSQTNNPNHFFCFLPNSYLYPISKTLQKDILSTNTLLIEASSIDTLNYQQINSDFDIFFKKNRILTFYNFYSLTTKIRLTFLFLQTNNNKNLQSIDKIFKNANWLEREFVEMYGTKILFQTDTRKLLLDYSLTDNPLLKDFVCENANDVFYNIFEEKVSYIRNNIIEL